MHESGRLQSQKEQLGTKTTLVIVEQQGKNTGLMRKENQEGKVGLADGNLGSVGYQTECNQAQAICIT